jgi:hypothetical protein
MLWKKKKGIFGIGSTFKERKCSIDREGKLTWDGPPHHGHVLLNSASMVTSHEGEGAKWSHSFMVQADFRSIIFAAESAEQKDKWMKAINSWRGGGSNYE